MIGAIAGDIIGSRFEGHPAPPPDFELFAPGCRFTDDTVCTLAVAEAIMADADFAATLRAFLRRHPDRGYGGMFRDWALRDGAPAYGSWGNGVPMRVAAVGWLATGDADCDRLAAAQAVVSHDHPDAVAGAHAVARAIRALCLGAAALELVPRLAAGFGYTLPAPIRGGFDVSAAGTVPPALTAAFAARDWEDAVRRAVGLGGDTDTLACIAGAVAETLHGVPRPIAERARADLTDDLRAVLARFEARIGRE